MKKLLFFLALLLTCSTSARAFDLGISAAGGFINFKTNESTEISKKGGAALLMLEVGMPILLLRLRAAGGFLGISSRGTKDGTSENHRHLGYLASLGSDVNLFSRLSAGVTLLYHLGKGASSRFVDKSTTRSVVYAGARLSYRMPKFTSVGGKEADLNIFAENLTDLNIGDNIINITWLGLGLPLP